MGDFERLLPFASKLVEHERSGEARVDDDIDLCNGNEKKPAVRLDEPSRLTGGLDALVGAVDATDHAAEDHPLSMARTSVAHIGVGTDSGAEKP
jgi:hypothetical protein